MTKDLFFGGVWQTGSGEDLVSQNPSDQARVWEGRAASGDQVEAAFLAARAALTSWRAQSADARAAICRRFAARVKEQSESLAHLISRETGKPLWESRSEVASVVAKVDWSIEALKTRRDTQSFEIAEYQAVVRYQPVGVLAILGPFNFPAHLPNGHLVPALLAGNTVVFKPSELTPGVGAWMVEQWAAVGLPAGVLNLVQGGRDTGVAVATDAQADGLLFTGSHSAGRALHRAFAEHPQKILALEMGGNNPLVVYRAGNLPAAAYLTALSAYLTSGQRCTCARRLILVEDQNTSKFLEELQSLIGRMSIGYFFEKPEPFLGTVIRAEAGSRIAREAQELIDLGARPLIPLLAHRKNPALLGPGLVDVTGLAGLKDEEVFGPLLTVRRVGDLTEAIEEANRTRFGLSAGLLSDDRSAWERFVSEIRAGIVNWNRQTTGASGRLPFGGCGESGNHRPAGYFSADYCSYPVGSLESAQLELPAQLEPGIRSASRDL